MFGGDFVELADHIPFLPVYKWGRHSSCAILGPIRTDVCLPQLPRFSAACHYQAPEVVVTLRNVTWWTSGQRVCQISVIWVRRHCFITDSAELPKHVTGQLQDGFVFISHYIHEFSVSRTQGYREIVTRQMFSNFSCHSIHCYNLSQILSNEYHLLLGLVNQAHIT